MMAGGDEKAPAVLPRAYLAKLCPCRDCTAEGGRHPGCHAKCERRREWEAAWSASKNAAYRGRRARDNPHAEKMQGEKLKLKMKH